MSKNLYFFLLFFLNLISFIIKFEFKRYFLIFFYLLIELDYNQIVLMTYPIAMHC